VNEIIFISILIIVCRYIQLRKVRTLRDYLKDGPWGDAVTYLFLIQFFRDNKCGTSDTRCLIGSEKVLVPSFYMKIVGQFFKDSQLIKYPWLPNFIIFSLFVPLAFLLYDNFEVIFASTYYPNKNPNFLIYLVILLFVSQIDNLDFGTLRMHWFTLQPRFLVVVVNSLFWLITFAISDDYIRLYSCTLLVFISLNTSIFARQCTIFPILFYSIISGDLISLNSFLVGFFLSCILFRKEFWKSLKPQWLYAKMYFRNYHRPNKNCNFFIYKFKLIFVSSLLELPKYPTFYFCFILITLEIYNNDLFFSWGTDSLYYRLFSFFLSIFLISFLTSLRFFASLGESWRYISCTCYFLPFFIFPFLLRNQFDDFTLILTFIVTLILQFSLPFTGKNEVNYSSLLLDALNKVGAEKLRDVRWHATPYRHGTFAVAHGFGTATFEFQYGNHSEAIYEKYFSGFGGFLKNDKEFIQKNRVTHLLVDKEYEFDQNNFSRVPNVNKILLGENKKFKIFQVQSHIR
jgi:hypothetical protein